MYVCMCVYHKQASFCFPAFALRDADRRRALVRLLERDERGDAESMSMFVLDSAGGVGGRRGCCLRGEVCLAVPVLSPVSGRLSWVRALSNVGRSSWIVCVKTFASASHMLVLTVVSSLSLEELFVGV